MDNRTLAQENTELKNQLAYYKEIAEYCLANHLHLKNMKTKEERERELIELKQLVRDDQQNGFYKLNKITGNLKTYKIQLDLLQKEMDNLNYSYNDTYKDYKEYRDTVLESMDYDTSKFDDKYIDEEKIQYIRVDDKIEQPRKNIIKEAQPKPKPQPLVIDIEEIEVRKDEVISLFTPKPHDRIEITDGTKVAPTPSMNLDDESKKLKNKIIKNKRDRNAKRNQIDTSTYASDQQLLTQIKNTKILELEHYYLSNNLFLALEPTNENINYVDHIYGPLSNTTNRNKLNDNNNNSSYNNYNNNDSYLYCPIPISNEIEYLSSLVTTTAYVKIDDLEIHDPRSIINDVPDDNRDIEQLSSDSENYDDDDNIDVNTKPKITEVIDTRKQRKAYLFDKDHNKKFNTIPHGDQ